MKTVFITGANGGLGYHLAEYLVKKDYFLILNYHVHKENLLILQSMYPSNTFLIQGDVSDEQQVYAMKKKCDDQGLKVDVLINNAGIDHVSEMNAKNTETFMRVWKVNTLGPFLMSKVFGEDINSRKGSIINITSDNTFGANDSVTMEYDASKAALNMLTYDFAKLYDDAYVNGIAFGWLDTAMNDFSSDMKKFIDFVPMEKAVKAIEDLFTSRETGKIEVIQK